MTANTFTVFVGGTEVNDYLLSEEEAILLAEDYTKAGYDDVVVVDVATGCDGECPACDLCCETKVEDK